jgi:integrase
MAEGIEVRHVGACRSLAGGRCSCRPTYRASVWSNREQKRIRKSFSTEAAAKAWRQDAAGALRRGEIRAVAAPLLDDAMTELLAAIDAGTFRTRGRRPFKPTTRRAAEQTYRLRVANRFGRIRLDRIDHLDLQEFVDELDATGTNPSTIEGAVLPLRLVYRWARARGIVAVDPTDGLELPEKSTRQRIPPSPADAAQLLAAVPEDDRPMWAAAMLAGLRRGELLALEWSNVDLKAGVLRVDRSYDPTSQSFGRPKSKHGVRSVPITAALAPHLREHALRSGRRDGLVFGATATRPLDSRRLQDRADATWMAACLHRVTLHACRHLYASMSIAAGVNAHALCRYMGHSSIAVTFDLYGHLFPGNESEAAALLDAYLERTFASPLDRLGST